MKDTKQCRTCGLIKSIKEYHKDGKGGYRKDCKPCRREIRSKTNAKNKIKEDDTKVCTACGEEKNIIKEFVQNGRDGYGPTCLDCYRVHKQSERERIKDEENTIISAILKLARNEEERLMELTKEDFISMTNGADILKDHKYKELKKRAFNELQKYGTHRDDSRRMSPGRYLIVSDSHGKHTKTKMFNLLDNVLENLEVDGIIHIGHMLDDDCTMSYHWDKHGDKLTVIPKLDEVYHLETIRNEKEYSFEMVRSEINIGDFRVINQDLQQDYVKTPISSLDQQLFNSNCVVNSHRQELFSRTTYANNDVMIYSPGSLCEKHIVKTIKQIDFQGGFTVKETRPEGYSKYRRMRHMYEYWQQGMILMDFDGSDVTVTPMRIYNIKGDYITSYFDKLFSSNGKVIEPDTKILLNGDVHVPSHDPDVLQIQEDVCADYEPDIFVNVGDFLDGDSLNHHAMDRNIPITSDTLDECAHAHYILKRMRGWADECHIIHGNHERFYDDFTDKFPQLSNLLDFKLLSDMEELGYTSTDIKDVLRIGSLNIVHGDLVFFGQTGSKLEKASKTFAGDTILGHLHSPGSRMHCHVMGLSGKKDQGYNEVNASNWVHGFAIVNQYKGYNFIHNLAIHRNTITLNGTKYYSKGSKNWNLPKYTVKMVYDM